MGIHHDTFSAVQPGKPGSAMYPQSPLGEKVKGIPTGRDVDWEPLVDYRRTGVSETTIHGAVAWAHGDEVIHSWRKRPLLRSLDDETLHAQSLHKRVGGLFVGTESHRCGLAQRGYRTCGDRPILAERIRVAVNAHAAGCPVDSIRTPGPPAPPLVPHLLG